MEFITQPWPWYVAGPCIAMVLALTVYFGESFGVSSTLRHMCAAGGAGKKISFFNYNWKDKVWNLVFALGLILGGFVASHFLQNPNALILNSETISDLNNLGFEFNGTIAPDSLFGTAALSSPKVLILLIIGGLLVGFGTRWAGGCTSGHAITGMSNLQLPSLIAVIGFFIGGLIMTHLLYPIIF